RFCCRKREAGRPEGAACAASSLYGRYCALRRWGGGAPSPAADCTQKTPEARLRSSREARSCSSLSMKRSSRARQQPRADAAAVFCSVPLTSKEKRAEDGHAQTSLGMMRANLLSTIELPVAAVAARSLLNLIRIPFPTWPTRRPRFFSQRGARLHIGHKSERVMSAPWWASR
ncbi:MAG: hypothetical protein RL033_6200, partial [Pseudomonadota bacterium]